MAETDKLQNLTMEQGATFRAEVSVYRPAPNPLPSQYEPQLQDLSGCTGRMEIRSRYNLGLSAVASLTSENGGIIVNAGGTVQMFCSGNVTLAIPVKAPIVASKPTTYVPPSQQYFYDLDLTYPSGDVVRICYGIVTVYATTTSEPIENDSPGSGDGSTPNPEDEDPLTTVNYSVAAGTAPEAVVMSSAGVAQHLFSITVLPTGQPHDSVALTDGPGGALLAVIPQNFPGGDVPLSAPRFFGASVYANTDSQSPAFSIGVGP